MKADAASAIIQNFWFNEGLEKYFGVKPRLQVFHRGARQTTQRSLGLFPSSKSTKENGLASVELG
jgi:hypothetical protein